MKRGNVKTVFYLLSGAVSGFVNGFFGTGGGIVLLFSMYIDGKYLGSKTPQKDRFAQTAVITLIFSVISVIFYLSDGRLDIGSCLIYLPSAAAGGYLGARLLEAIDTVWLCRIFSMLIIFAGGMMLFR